MSNLVEHARRELEILGEEPETIEGYLKIMQAFGEMGHSGGSASVAIPTITKLLQFENLKPLTTKPEEWVKIPPEMWGTDRAVWQNQRNSKAFSDDGGKTYWLVDDKPNLVNYKSEKHIKKYVHELWEFAVRQPEALKPGTKVVFCHAPFEGHNEWKNKPFTVEAQILNVNEASWAELHPRVAEKGNRWATEKNLVIFYSAKGGDAYRYASDSGLVPYVREDKTEFYNDTNFVILADALEEANIEILSGIPNGHTVRPRRDSFFDYMDRKGF